MADNPTLKKLRWEAGQRAIVLNAPESYRRLLEDVGASAELSGTPDASFDFIHVFATKRADLETLAPTLRAAARPETMLWVSYPKGAAIPTDLKRDVVWAALDPAGLRPCAQVAIDDVWSALRFKPA